jgi:hypothetical protein
VKQKDDYPIDIVLFWVDGNDQKWLEDKAKYAPGGTIPDDRAIRYRDWDNLQYLFRSIEQFAPWVNNVFFVTWGHVPEWLNTTTPGLTIIKHEDFIPEEYNPTFSSHVKELNIHRIKGLSERFIYFNDDMFLLRRTTREDLKKNGKPCDCAILTAHSHNEAEPYMFMQYRATGMVNKHFNMREVIRTNRGKWFSMKYGKMLFRSWVLSGFPRFPGFWQQHMPYSLLKSTLNELWEKEYNAFHELCFNRFRNALDFNIWVFRNWQLAAGDFYPRSVRIGKSFIIGDENSLSDVRYYIEKQKGKIICINDAEMSWEAFIDAKQRLIDSFEKILPKKSKYEV